VLAGWNLIGSISSPVDTGSIVSVPPGIRGSHWFGYANGYNPSLFLMPGRGYWVKATAPGKFLLTGPGAASRFSLDAAQAQSLDIPNALTITDKLGRRQTLYFGSDEHGQRSTSLFDMPPPPPAGAFDARFVTASGGSMVRTISLSRSGHEEFPIAIQSDAYPVTLSWKLQESTWSYEVVTEADGKSIRQLNAEGSLTIADPRITTILLRVNGNRQLPDEFMLSRNYPNPFNPSTSVSYALPVDSYVRIEIFDLIGRHVRTLVAETESAGYYTVAWDGCNNEQRQLATGLYFLRMEARGVGVMGSRSFGEIRKMLLLK
jgi:hypothetical protein